MLSQTKRPDPPDELTYIDEVWKQPKDILTPGVEDLSSGLKFLIELYPSNSLLMEISARIAVLRIPVHYNLC